jgi:Flp pilus assembly protein TadD
MRVARWPLIRIMPRRGTVSGKALSALKRHKAAVACYDKALALAPENKTIWKDCGAALARL